MARKGPAVLHFRRARETAEEGLRRWTPRTNQSPVPQHWLPVRRECLRPALAAALLILLAAMLVARLLGLHGTNHSIERPTVLVGRVPRRRGGQSSRAAALIGPPQKILVTAGTDC